MKLDPKEKIGYNLKIQESKMFYSDFADDYEKIFPFSESVYKFLVSYKPSHMKKILDIGCATGHYCGKFTSEGFDATGIDLDSQMILSAENKYNKATFLEMNLNDISSIREQFDMVYSTGNVVAHVPEDDLNIFLDNLKNILTEKGVWIFQVINWDYILTLKEFNFPLIETDTKSFYRKYTNITKNTLIFNTELIDKRSGKSLFKDKVTMYPMPSEHYIKLHEDKGFKLRGHFSDYGKKPFDSKVFSADIYVFSAATSA
ncbi:MAG: class I SAM-dependent methyltransferase [Spirochaetaceae bacterium]|jgi:2-polyprenyl-3-methyl-5-hydroxy-6-metoxy-1,4-benzoquinol methylase|nr:class I SAM-dependent methyltransferase [Spirochaetaceae bacterium]